MKKCGINLKGIPMNKEKKLSLLDKIDLGVHRGVARAIAEHKKAGCSIVVLQDGRVVKIPADKIQVDEKLIQR